MRRGIISLLLVVGFLSFGCSYGIYNPIDCSDLNSLCEYVNSQIEYVSDCESIYGTKEYFQSPMETDYLKTGDCEDFSVYFMYLAKQEFGIKLNFVVILIKNMGYHAMTEYNNVYYCPTNGYIFNELPEHFYPIIKFNYDEIMIYSTGFYTKGIE